MPSIPRSRRTAASIVLSGNHGGLIDLYRLTMETGALDRLTSDAFADLEPTFTPDGRRVVFVTERFTTNLQTLEPGALRLASLDLATREVRPISAFLTGKHLSPQVSPDGRQVTFVADPDGISNLYRVPIDGGPILQLSSFLTGIAGIATTSPTLSSASNGRLAFSVFENDGHSIYVLDQETIVALVPAPATTPAALLPGRTIPAGDVYRLLTDQTRGLPPVTSQPEVVPYKRGLKLDAIGQPTISAGISEFGGYAGGSVSAFFSDMLGDRQLAVGAQMSGSLQDLGGSLTYVSRRHRWNWVATVEQMPFRVRYFDLSRNNATDIVAITETIERQTSRGVFAGAAYPFNPSMRLEFSGGMRALTFTQESIVNTYVGDTGQHLGRERFETTLADPMQLAEGSVALVRDSTYFGATGPIYGSRSRLELGRTTGSLQFSTVMADLRRYWMPRRPVTLGARVIHLGRYGTDAEHPQLVDLFLGQQDLVHGYGYGSFDATECAPSGPETQCIALSNIVGSRLLVANFEARAPLVGLFTGDLEYGRLPIDVSAFFDAGVAWSSTTSPLFAGGNRDVIRSVGGAIRINAFNLLIVEVAASHPLDRLAKGLQWQIGLDRVLASTMGNRQSAMANTSAIDNPDCNRQSINRSDWPIGDCAIDRCHCPSAIADCRCLCHCRLPIADYR